MENITEVLRSPLFWVLAAIAVIVVIIVVSQNKKASEKKTETFMAAHSAPAAKPDKYCFNCGSPMRAAAKFCPRCGKSVQPSRVRVKSAPRPKADVTEKKPAETPAPKPPADPVCPFCESLLPPGAALCPACGNAVAPSADTSKSRVRVTYEKRPAPASRPSSLLSTPDDSDL